MEENWISATYENVHAKCPHCAQENIFNRASDLQTFDAVSGQDVCCLNSICRRQFHILGDLINPAFEMFVFDCAWPYEQKRYSYCIVSLAQAWEIFFSNYLRVEFIYKKYAADGDLERMNRGLHELYEITKRWTFEPLRNIFIRLQIKPGAVADLDSLASQSAQLTQRPARADLAQVDERLRIHIERLYDSTIGELRNQIVHKHAYRPRKEEVDHFMAEIRATLFPLRMMLGVQGDEINWYVQKFREGEQSGR